MHPVHGKENNKTDRLALSMLLNIAFDVIKWLTVLYKYNKKAS